MIGPRHTLRPFHERGRRTIIAIFLIFAAMAGVEVALSLSAAHRSQNRAAVVEIAARQRTLAERYVKDVLLVRAGERADPASTAAALSASAHALLEGGPAPAVNGDDDQSTLPAARGATLRRQIEEEILLLGDLSANGRAVLAGAGVTGLPSSAHEHTSTRDPLLRLRAIAALSSATSLNVTRTIAEEAEANVNDLITTQIALAIGGLLVSLLLAWALIAATRRQTAHFRSLAQSSHDLVVVLGSGGCRYVSRSVALTVGRAEAELFGEGFERFVHEEDRPILEGVCRSGGPAELSFRILGAGGEWRHLDARATDLRGDRHLRGVVLNARDTTDRVRLEQELNAQAHRDSFASQLAEALEMADEEEAVSEVVERAMVQTAAATPMELLLSDSSRANLNRVASNPTQEAPGCPVKSPFSCVAVRRGSAVVFDSSEVLNACPHLRDRAGGACSAVCVPVSFMGRSLGVLHTTGPDHRPLGREQVTQLATLAAQAGSRIGTVRAFEKTQLQASTDGLTGLVNRRTAEKDLRAMIKNGSLFSVAIADLDKFKQLNDTHGHEAGDRALRLFAQVTQETLRDHDLIARWGGEEFVIVLPELDRVQAVEVLERVRVALANAHPGETARFTASFGVTDSNQAETLEQLLHIADSGLYAAKQSGRDRTTIGEPTSGGSAMSAIAQAEATTLARARRGRPSMHEAAEDEDPRPSGLEIR
ncbi:MAG TPA: diguanylate cyclase [Solirubrobacteraceae bacterium]